MMTEEVSDESSSTMFKAVYKVEVSSSRSCHHRFKKETESLPETENGRFLRIVLQNASKKGKPVQVFESLVLGFSLRVQSSGSKVC